MAALKQAGAVTKVDETISTSLSSRCFSFGKILLVKSSFLSFIDTANDGDRSTCAPTRIMQEYTRPECYEGKLFGKVTLEDMRSM